MVKNSASDSTRRRGPLTRAVLAAAAAPTALADIAETAKTNRGVLTDLVRIEVERAVGALGLVTPSDVMALRKRVGELERRLASVEAGLDRGAQTQRDEVAKMRAGAAPKLGAPAAAPTAPANGQEPAPTRAAKSGAIKTARKKPAAKKAASKKSARKNPETARKAGSGSQRPAGARKATPAQRAAAARADASSTSS